MSSRDLAVSVFAACSMSRCCFRLGGRELYFVDGVMFCPTEGACCGAGAGTAAPNPNPVVADTGAGAAARPNPEVDAAA